MSLCRLRGLVWQLYVSQQCTVIFCFQDEQSPMTTTTIPYAALPLSMSYSYLIFISSRQIAVYFSRMLINGVFSLSNSKTSNIPGSKYNFCNFFFRVLVLGNGNPLDLRWLYPVVPQLNLMRKAFLTVSRSQDVPLLLFIPNRLN